MSFTVVFIHAFVHHKNQDSPKYNNRSRPRLHLSSESSILVSRTNQLTLLTPKLMTTNLPNDSNLMNLSCPGTAPLRTWTLPLTLTIETPVAKKPVGYSEYSTKTSPRQNSSSKLLQNVHPESRLPSGNEFSKEIPSISTRSTHHSIMLSLMKRERDAWETRKYLLASLNQNDALQQQRNGPQHGEEQLKLSPLPFPTDEKNSSSTVTTSTQNFLQKSCPVTTNSYYTTSPSATKLQPAKASSLLTTASSADCTWPSYYQTELKGLPKDPIPGNLQNPKVAKNLF